MMSMIMRSLERAFSVLNKSDGSRLDSLARVASTTDDSKNPRCIQDKLEELFSWRV